ncbi:MAG: GPO family capsid scaffolding protein [Proteobacteria bacterium]|nr:GPO family capsid scaffolding protein [Pseudomonadota bacterium]
MASKSKFFRVATEGATTDGRAIERKWIEQMAKNFNRAQYGARVWLEHYRGTVPGGPFDALGDVTAVEARAVEAGKLALFVQIEPLPALVEMNKKKQKLYTSIEVHPDFADSGEAYLSGLAVTDSPASLGTEMLAFAAGATANPLAARKSDKDALFSEAVPLALEFEDAPAADGGALAAMVAMFSKTLEKLTGTSTAPAAPTPAPQQPPVQQHSADVHAALAKAGEVVQAFAKQQAQDAQALATLTASVQVLSSKHDALVTQLSNTPGGGGRPEATGGNGVVLADC